MIAGLAQLFFFFWRILATCTTKRKGGYESCKKHFGGKKEMAQRKGVCNRQI